MSDILNLARGRMHTGGYRTVSTMGVSSGAAVVLHLHNRRWTKHFLGLVLDAEGPQKLLLWPALSDGDATCHWIQIVWKHELHHHISRQLLSFVIFHIYLVTATRDAGMWPSYQCLVKLRTGRDEPHWSWLLSVASYEWSLWELFVTVLLANCRALRYDAT